MRSFSVSTVTREPQPTSSTESPSHASRAGHTSCGSASLGAGMSATPVARSRSYTRTHALLAHATKGPHHAMARVGPSPRLSKICFSTWPPSQDSGDRFTIHRWPDPPPVTNGLSGWRA